MSIFSVGAGALNAAQAGILTTGHNIANASTPGYSRQAIVQGTNIANLTGSGYIGSGTHVQTVRRIYDQFLGRQILSAEAGVAEMDTYLSQIQQMDNLLADPDAGLSPAMADFFKGVQEVAANPSSIPGRQSMLSAAQSLAARFQGLDQRMSEIRDGLNTQLHSQVESINTLSTQLADINQRIIIAEAGSVAQVPNDLLDQRDQMVRDLNKVIRVNTVTQSDGSFNVFFGNGQPLVVGAQTYTLRAVTSNTDPERFVVAMEGIGGTLMSVQESQVSGGSLGGLLSFRSGALDQAQNALGRIAITLAQNFNDQHNQGMDLTGKIGGDFFKLPTPVLRASVLNTGDPNLLPTVTLDVDNLAKLSDSDYELSSPDGINFELKRLSDGTVTAITDHPQSVDGMLIETNTWVPGAGDSIVIQPTRAGARNLSVAIRDPRAIAAALPIRTAAALTNQGSGAIDAGQVTDTQNAAFGNFAASGQLAPPILIRFDSPATTYSIYDATLFDPSDLSLGLLEGGIAFNSGAPVFPTPAQTLDYGYQVTLSGAPAAGDQFTVGGNKNGISDNRNAMLLGALQTQSTMLAGETYGPTATYQSAYSQIVSAVGSKTAEVKTIGAAQQGLADHATTTMQEISGVNLDEEAANLLRYQQAYQAAAKILEIAGRVFDEVIALGR
jgi:flagellar hook-associated protein 1 FlgK